jgi:hypothetical protein
MFVNKNNQRKIDQPSNSPKVNHHNQPDLIHQILKLLFHNHNHGKVRRSSSEIDLFYFHRLASQTIQNQPRPQGITFLFCIYQT